jgi:hypothetical protein
MIVLVQGIRICEQLGPDTAILHLQPSFIFQSPKLPLKSANIGLITHIIFEDFIINCLEHFTFSCAIYIKLTRHRGNFHVLHLL